MYFRIIYKRKNSKVRSTAIAYLQLNDIFPKGPIQLEVMKIMECFGKTNSTDDQRLRTWLKVFQSEVRPVKPVDIKMLQRIIKTLFDHYNQGGSTRKLAYERLGLEPGQIDLRQLQWLSNLFNVAREDEDFQQKLFIECYQ